MNTWTTALSGLVEIWVSLSNASKILLVYGGLMALAWIWVYVHAMSDVRTLREVSIWAKPMKFMAATALFAWTTVLLAVQSRTVVEHHGAYIGITTLLIITSLFEVVYITYQAALAEPSHYNTSDPFHALMFGLMGLGAVGLTASQIWLAWEIWHAQDGQTTLLTWGILVGLVFTFVLGTVSGFMLGSQQPPAGPGLPLVGWHLQHDIRPAHFLGVHAQQCVPLIGLLAERLAGPMATQSFVAGVVSYSLAWVALTWLGLS
jgi:hypothetical protein